MRKNLYLLMVGLGTVMLSPVSAEANDGVDSNPSIEKDTDAKIKVGNKLYARDETVCKRFAQTGTRIKTKTCMSAGQWHQRELDAKSMTDDIQAGINSTRPE